MSQPENTFIASVHRHLPVELYRMKNHNQYNGGIADVWYSGPKADLWIEYKFITVPTRDSTTIDLTFGKNPTLSRLQQDWLRSRFIEGRNVWVVVGCKMGGVVFQGTTWEQPITADRFKELTISRATIANAISNHVL